MMGFTDLLVIITIIFYFLSTASYFAYLFFQKDYLHRLGIYILGTGFVAHTTLIGTTFMHIGSIPAHNLHQTLSLAGWILAGVFLTFQYRFGLRVLGIFIAPLATFTMIISSRLPITPDRLDESFKSFWLILHVVIIFTGEAAFALACGVGILYLLQEHAIKTKKRGFFFNRLPSLEMLDSTGYACIITGFTMVTIGLLSGFLYARSIWGRFWSWDPKEVWSGIMWLFYAALLHERLVVGWRGRKSAIMSIIGFVVLLFTFLGVNFFLKGHHGDFTQW
ncbi:c-type cytochrome biogenesis protein CcsB [Desulfonema ishimotonii]|uniref:C-type cytochrome biogenesis protein CcsB n=1 Tax=Desulfonema ishimotonii TaxID=45657 RepID=A0A401G1W0_9BACT|nr:c-type cytochrome biogenesis protein CcsB [Desulfonema ishimotonii]GBC63185.1 c-type cytochrome biogenesis protein CcsB [Desulfonema ishimotonii]